MFSSLQQVLHTYTDCILREVIIADDFYERSSERLNENMKFDTRIKNMKVVHRWIELEKIIA